MCGIVGAVSLSQTKIPNLQKKLDVMSSLIEHRGPDGSGAWHNDAETVGLAHRRLAIIDLTDSGAQPMHAPNRTTITYNGEVYNYRELQKTYEKHWDFKSESDTETILAAYSRHGEDTASQLRGMFAYALWDHDKNELHCARDRFGIKPFYYTEIEGVLYFASEVKALAPLLPQLDMDQQAFSEYLTFQYPITNKTLFKNIFQLMPGHSLIVKNGRVEIKKYWDVTYTHDHSITVDQAKSRIRELIEDSTDIHLRADVPIGSYLSGGVDSSLIALLASQHSKENNLSFHGKFTQFPGYDESSYAKIAAKKAGNTMHEIDITAQDFANNMSKIIYHLDYPVAGPGSFPQYMVSGLTAQHRKVVLGGQGGDEIFGGYARYLAGYLEQLIKGGLEGRLDDGSFTVSFESILPNMSVLENYKPLLQKSWKEGLWGDLDMRFYSLIDRSSDLRDEVDRSVVDMEHVHEAYKTVFNDRSAIQENMYLDSMTRFDFKCLLPALLQVEDRMGMAHGLESRVPLLDHPLVEYVATLPPEVKYADGRLKELLRASYKDLLPTELTERKDKMGFPVPLKEWYAGELRDFIQDTFTSRAAMDRPFMDSEKVLENFNKDSQFSRKTWGLLSLELWHQNFYDKAHEYRALLN